MPRVGEGLLLLRECGCVLRVDCYGYNEQSFIDWYVQVLFHDTVAIDEKIRLVVKKKVGGAAGVEPAGHGRSVTLALRASLYEVGVGAENGSVLPDELLCSLLRLLAHTLRCTL